MTDFTIKGHTLRDLKKKFDSKVFAIPEIQRSYVWKKEAICKLLDSILKNYPVGIALVWDIPPAKAIHVRPDNKTIIPPFNKRGANAELIIDGQQRLSTLYGILNGVTPKAEINSKINFTELFFDCNKLSEKRFVFNKSYSVNTKGFIRLTDLINTPPAILIKSLKLNKKEAEQLKICNAAFHTYKFYILSFKGFDFDDVREIFIRVNSAGMTISRADNLFAQATNVNLRDHMLETKRGLENGFKDIATDAMQNTVALCYGAEKLGGLGFTAFLNKIEKSKTAEKDFLKKWKNIEYGYKECVDFLVSHFHIKNIKDLPSTNIFSMLSFFFAENQRRATPFQIKQIKKWFWYTSCAERYSGREFNKNIPGDIKFFKSLATKKEINFPINHKINFYDFLRTDYRSIGGRSSAYYTMLRNKKPLYLQNGHPILLHKASDVSNRKDRHHIFPNALLKKNHINEKWINSIVNICFIESDENQSIGDRLPRTYLLGYKVKKHFLRVMNSHLIPVDNKSPVWGTDVKEVFLPFLNIRAKTIIEEIEKCAGVKLFEEFEPLKRI